MASLTRDASSSGFRLAGAAPAGEATDCAVKGVIGPNAITRLQEALALMCGQGACETVFRKAGLAHCLDAPPTSMVDENDVLKLHQALLDEVGHRTALRIGAEAGRLTGVYLLGHRIPRQAQRVLALLPVRAALMVLLAAIQRHAWTFAGSGAFSYSLTPEPCLVLEDCPLLSPERPERAEIAAVYFAATFETVFGTIVGPYFSHMRSERTPQSQAAFVFRFSCDPSPFAHREMKGSTYLTIGG